MPASSNNPISVFQGRTMALVPPKFVSVLWKQVQQMRSLLFFVFSLSLLAGKKPEPQWKIGRVLDSHLAKSSVAVGSTTSTTGTATVTGSDGLATASGQ